MIVWILDDDGDMDPNHAFGDLDSDAYVVDYGADGTVDRLLDFIDENGDDRPDIQEQRYFSEGRLRHSIMHLDLDGDGHFYPVHDYQRLVGNRLTFLIDAYGDNLFYHNKYDPQNRAWIPLGECPFAFHDLDGNGHSDRAVRISAAPLDFSASREADYANSWARLMGPIEPIMREPGIVAVRYSADIDGGASLEQPLHYELGFHMIGASPYEQDRFRLVHELRRPPRASYTVSHAATLALAENYPAEATGFSWREFRDGTRELGDWRKRPEEDRRWEGVFWTWQRIFMPNTGGPEQFRNVRREFDSGPSSSRELYYSPVDRRVHLKGAEEGWLPIGALTGDESFGEVRMFDTDDDGYFDRWEYWLDGQSRPYRTATVPHAKNRNLGSDLGEIGSVWADSLLPKAIATVGQVVEALRQLRPDAALPAWLQAAKELDVSESEHLYRLEVEMEVRFLELEERIATVTAPYLADSGETWLPLVPDLLERKTRSWRLATLKARSDAALVTGDLESVLQAIGRIGPLLNDVSQPLESETPGKSGYATGASAR